MKKTIVVDTSILIAALLSETGASREVLRGCLLGQYQPLMGAALYREYESLIRREEVFKKGILTLTEREALLDAFMKVCQWVHIYYLWRPNLSDEADNHIVELAVAGNAEWIVTHNARDFRKGELLFPHIKIMQPNQVLEVT